MTATISHAALLIATALFDSLWEGVLIVGAVWLALRCLPKVGAATRYAIWLCTLMALVLIPVLTVAVQEPRLREPAIGGTVASSTVISTQSRVSIASVGQPQINTARVASEPARMANQSTAVISLTPRNARITIPQGLALAAAFIWTLLFCARGLLLLVNIRDLVTIRRDAWFWSAAHDYPVFLSNRVQVPLAVGFLRAAVILPASLVERLGAQAVETIIVHEIAHLRRYDAWTNAFARIVEAFVALNPAAWFIMRRLSMEREIACDDWVVARTGDGNAFARALATMAGDAGTRMPIAAPSAIGSRHSIVVRIERLLDSRPRRLRLSPSALGGALMVLALIAFTVQSISPVLAYAAQPNIQAQGLAALQTASSCATPNRGIRMRFFFPVLKSYEPAEASTIVSRFGAANVATVKLTVDAKGTPHNVVVLSAPRYPGMVEYVTRLLTTSTYEPAIHNCAPVAATLQTAVHVGKPYGNTFSIVAPAYPNGWGARNKSSCKVPNLLHTGVPKFPESIKNVSLARRFNASVGVHVNAAGAATRAWILKTTGEIAFDTALLTAARTARYPLTEATGFKPVRPSNASLSWNASHGSNVYSRCDPLPTDYVWSTTFEEEIPSGFPGSTFDGMWV